MRTMFPLILALLLSVSAFGQSKEQTPLEKENARYAAELEAAQKKLLAEHVARLKGLQKKAMTDADLDTAIAIRDEIKKFEGKPEVKEEAKPDKVAAAMKKMAGKWGQIEADGNISRIWELHEDGTLSRYFAENGKATTKEFDSKWDISEDGTLNFMGWKSIGKVSTDRFKGGAGGETREYHRIK